MNCAEFEQLMDAYLDGELSGSWRLEFDTHRLRCRRCQLAMVMMESIGSVISSDRQSPALADNFTDRVMATIEERRPWNARLRPTRAALVAGVVLQAAAVLSLVIWLPAQHRTITTNAGSAAATPAAADLAAPYGDVDSKSARHEALVEQITSLVERGGAHWASDLSQIRAYVSALSVPDEIAQASTGLDEANPWGVLLRAMLPGESEEPKSAPPATDQHSL
jgi:anti-sigma factor RsiW